VSHIAGAGAFHSIPMAWGGFISASHAAIYRSGMALENKAVQ